MAANNRGKGTGDFRTDRERERWLGNELTKSTNDPTKLDPTLAAVVAANGLSKAEARKLQKAQEKAAEAQYKKLMKGLQNSIDTMSEAQREAIVQEVRSIVSRAAASSKGLNLNDAVKTLNVSAAQARKQEKLEREAFEKKQGVQQLALTKTLAYLKLEIQAAKEAGKDADAKRLTDLTDRYDAMLELYRGRGDKQSRDKIAELEAESQKLLDSLTDAKSQERVSSALQSSLDKARAIQDKLDTRYKKREDTLKDMQKSIDGFRKNLKEKFLGSLGIGRFNVLNAIKLSRKISNTVKATTGWVRDYRDLRHYRKTGEVRGYARSVAPGAPQSPDAPETAPESSQNRDTYRHRLLGELRNIARHVGKRQPSSGSAARDDGKSLLSGITSSLSSFVEGLGGTLKKFGAGLVSTVGPALALAAAGAIGYKIGEWLNEQPWFKNTVGKATSKAINVGGKILTGRDVDKELTDDHYYTKEELEKKARDYKKNSKPLTREVTGKIKPIAVPPPTPVPDTGESIRNKAADTLAPPSPPVTPASPGSMSSPVQASPVSADMTSQRGKLFRIAGSDVDTDGVNSSIQNNFLGMASEYKDRTGKLLGLTDAKRDTDKQRSMWEANRKSGSPKKVAPPGTSLHEYGYALDVPSADGNRLDSMGLLSKFGFTRPVSGEPWHIQPVGISLAAAKQGLFSADYASDQQTTSVGAGFSGGNTTAAVEGFSAPPKVTDTADSSEPATGQSSPTRASGSASAPVGVNSIPTFSTVDGTLLAMNVNALGGG